MRAGAPCDDRHRHQEWLRFLRIIDKLTAQDKEVHLIVDNYSTHKHPQVKRWLARHARFQVHFTPVCSSLNMVERFSAIPRRNSCAASFETSRNSWNRIGEYIDNHNRQPKPFIWTAKRSDILEKVKSAHAALAYRDSA
jgi:hypothetical protein